MTSRWEGGEWSNISGKKAVVKFRKEPDFSTQDGNII